MNRRSLVRKARAELRRRGVEITRTDPDCPPYSFLELVVFPVLGINCVIDVGASRGEFAAHLRDHGYTGRIVSFEPQSDNYRILQGRAASDTNWFTHHLALGEHDGVGELHVARGSFWHSFLLPSDYGLREFGEEIEIVGMEQVDVRRLDSVFDEATRDMSNPVVYLKLDTQGYDRQVLLAGTEALPHIPALQTEISFQREYEGMTPFDEMIRVLEGLGYSLAGIFKVFRDRKLALSEADGIFVRPPAD